MDLFRKIGSLIGLASESPQPAPITSPETRQNGVAPKSNKRKLNENDDEEENNAKRSRQIATKSRQDLDHWFDGSRADVHTVTFTTAGALGVVLQEVDDGVCLNKVLSYTTHDDASKLAVRDVSEHEIMWTGDYVIALNKADVRHLGVDDLMKLMNAVQRPLAVTFRHASKEELIALAIKWPSRFGDNKKKVDKEKKKAKRKENKKKKKTPTK